MIVLCSGTAVAQSSASDGLRLADLAKPQEREVQAVRFMLAVSPSPVSPAARQCAVDAARSRSRQFFASLYQAELPEAVMEQALRFFGSNDGKGAVAIRQIHELRFTAAAMSGQGGLSEKVPYPANIQRAVDAFAATDAGRYFYWKDDLESRPRTREGLTDLRNRIVVECLANAPAAPAKN